MGKNIEGDIDFFAKFMSILYALLQRSKVKIVALRTKAEVFSPYIYRISPGTNSCLKAFIRTCRREQFCYHIFQSIPSSPIC